MNFCTPDEFLYSAGRSFNRANVISCSASRSMAGRSSISLPSEALEFGERLRDIRLRLAQEHRAAESLIRFAEIEQRFAADNSQRSFKDA